MNGRLYRFYPKTLNDDSTYRSFFGCKPEIRLPEIDFSAKSLLIGLKTDHGSEQVNSPANISRIEQKMERDENGDLILHVTITGRKGGGEWFGFTSLIPKSKRKVALKMNYLLE